MTYGVYGANGIRYTVVSGSTRTGLFAADGSYNIVLDDTTYKGLYHPCGAYRVNSNTSIQRTYDASGAFYLGTFFGRIDYLAPSGTEGYVYFDNSGGLIANQPLGNILLTFTDINGLERPLTMAGGL